MSDENTPLERLPSPAVAEPQVPTTSADAGTPAGGEEASTSVLLGLSRADALFVGIVGVVIAALLGVHWWRLTGGGLREVEIVRQPPRPFDSRLDLNSATWVELAQLDAVGETLARRIVEHRERHGPFRDVEELRKVRGIGAKTLDKLRPWLTLGKSEAKDAPAERR